MWNEQNNPYGKVPSALWVGCGGMAIAEVTKAQHDFGMIQWAGTFFGVEYEGKFYLKGTQREIDLILKR